MCSFSEMRNVLIAFLVDIRIISADEVHTLHRSKQINPESLCGSDPSVGLSGGNLGSSVGLARSIPKSGTSSRDAGSCLVANCRWVTRGLVAISVGTPLKGKARVVFTSESSIHSQLIRFLTCQIIKKRYSKIEIPTPRLFVQQPVHSLPPPADPFSLHHAILKPNCRILACSSLEGIDLSLRTREQEQSSRSPTIPAKTEAF